MAHAAGDRPDEIDAANTICVDAPPGQEQQLAPGHAEQLAPGTMVGEFRIESLIGAGGMATVYAAIQPLIGKRAAIKVIGRHLCVDPINVERFVQEARAANHIGHPNIIDAFAFGVLPDGRHYIVMEWLQGETLAARLSHGRMPLPDAFAIIFQICDALAACHEKGIIHRDLKPDNVFLVPVRNRRLLVKLLDFGVAKLRPLDGGLGPGYTMPGSTVGTPAYMAPEQARGKEVDHRADIYALGVTAYEMLTGRLPFVGDDIIDLMHQQIHAQPPAPSTLRPGLPVQLERLLLQMLEKQADRRPTLAQVEAQLAEVQAQLAHLGDEPPVAVAWAPTLAASTDEVAPVAPSLATRAPRAAWRWALGAVALLLAALGVLASHRSAPLTATPTEPEASAPGPALPPAAAPREPPSAPAAPAAEAPATLRVTVNRSDARIELDGQLVATGAKEARIPLSHGGAHVLTVSAPRQRTVRRELSVVAGAEEHVDIALQPISLPSPAPPRPHHRDDMIDPFER